MIGHEITAFTGITHGESLALIHCSLLHVLREQKKGKLLQYAERVWNITEGTDDERIDKAIAATRNYFRSIGLRTSLTEAHVGQDVIDAIVKRFKEIGAKHGEAHNVDAEMTRKILEQAK